MFHSNASDTHSLEKERYKVGTSIMFKGAERAIDNIHIKLYLANKYLFIKALH